jgi:hypothetical protein
MNRAIENAVREHGVDTAQTSDISANYDAKRNIVQLCFGRHTRTASAFGIASRVRLTANREHVDELRGVVVKDS